MKWMPKTKIGKYSFWLTMLGIALLFVPYWLSMIFNSSSILSPAMLSILFIITFGILSIVSIFKYKDKCIVLFISGLFGLFGIFLVIGELIFPH